MQLVQDIIHATIGILISIPGGSILLYNDATRSVYFEAKAR